MHVRIVQVVAGQSRVQVTLANNAKFDALVRGSDPEKDLAVLKIASTDEILTPVQVATQRFMERTISCAVNPIRICVFLTLN